MMKSLIYIVKIEGFMIFSENPSSPFADAGG